MGNGAKGSDAKALKKDLDATGFSTDNTACGSTLPCKKKRWIGFHVLDVTDAKKGAKYIKPVKGTRIATKLPGPGDTDVISAKKPVKVKALDDGTASIKQIERRKSLAGCSTQWRVPEPSGYGSAAGRTFALESWSIPKAPASRTPAA